MKAIRQNVGLDTSIHLHGDTCLLKQQHEEKNCKKGTCAVSPPNIKHAKITNKNTKREELQIVKSARCIFSSSLWTPSFADFAYF